MSLTVIICNFSVLSNSVDLLLPTLHHLYWLFVSLWGSFLSDMHFLPAWHMVKNEKCASASAWWERRRDVLVCVGLSYNALIYWQQTNNSLTMHYYTDGKQTKQKNTSIACSNVQHIVTVVEAAEQGRKKSSCNVAMVICLNATVTSKLRKREKKCTSF